MIELVIFGLVCVGLLIFARRQMEKDQKDFDRINKAVDKLIENNPQYFNQKI